MSKPCAEKPYSKNRSIPDPIPSNYYDRRDRDLDLLLNANVDTHRNGSLPCLENCTVPILCKRLIFHV